jgi:hypothetical protein
MPLSSMHLVYMLYMLVSYKCLQCNALRAVTVIIAYGGRNGKRRSGARGVCSGRLAFPARGALVRGTGSVLVFALDQGALFEAGEPVGL